MNPNKTVCNYALLRFTPYPQTGEVVNVGVVVNCIQPCFLHLRAEETMPMRVKALFPDYNAAAFAAAVAAMCKEVKRINGRPQGPTDCQVAFNELVRPRENAFRYGEIRTVLTEDPLNLCEELFRSYVRMESSVRQAVMG